MTDTQVTSQERNGRKIREGLVVSTAMEKNHRCRSDRTRSPCPLFQDSPTDQEALRARRAKRRPRRRPSSSHGNSTLVKEKALAAS